MITGINKSKTLTSIIITSIIVTSIIDDSVITCDEILNAEERRTVKTNFNEKNAICKAKNVYIILAFLSITIALLIAVTICCCLIKYKAKKTFAII